MICGRRLRQKLISSRPLQATTSLQQHKRAAPCCSRIGISTSVPPPPPPASSNSSSVVAAEPAAVDNGEDKATAPAAGAEATAAGRATVSGRSEWRPSEAHKASATSVARKQAQSARLKAGVAPRVAALGTSTSEIEKARSPGLRRRELLGGAEDLPSQIAAASASTPTKAAAATAASAGEASSRSVVSLSATARFRARRELERLAAAGNAEAIEALRASETSPTSLLSSQGESAGGTGQSGGGGGFTPLTVLPVLLALVGAGYCVVNDLVPQEWLSWIGGGADSSGDSASESRNVQEEGGASPLSPLLRTLSRAAAFVPVNSSTETPAVPAHTDEDASGDVGTKVDTASCAETAEETAAAGEVEQEGGGGWGLRRWWRNGASDGVTRPAGDVDGGREESDSKFLSLEPAGGRSGIVESLRQDEASQQQRQKQPRWLPRWRAPPPPAPSGSS